MSSVLMGYTLALASTFSTPATRCSFSTSFSFTDTDSIPDPFIRSSTTAPLLVIISSTTASSFSLLQSNSTSISTFFALTPDAFPRNVAGVRESRSNLANKFMMILICNEKNYNMWVRTLKWLDNFVPKNHGLRWCRLVFAARTSHTKNSHSEHVTIMRLLFTSVWKAFLCILKALYFMHCTYGLFY